MEYKIALIPGDGIGPETEYARNTAINFHTQKFF